MSSISELLNKNPDISHILHTAGNLGDELNIPTFVVGGCVRDFLLGRSTTDIDIMVEGNGLDFAKQLSKLLDIGTTVEYEKFGTAMIPHSNIEIEIATARKETYSSTSRKPEIISTTIDEDLSRRDFTINAMAASLLPNNFGELLDPFGGITDLHKGLIITPLDPDETFSDDPLRMLRAVRFASQLEFNIASLVLDSIHNQKHRIEIISWERITEEISKILKSNKPSIAFYLLKEVGLLSYVFPELDVMSGVEVINGKGHKDVFSHTLLVVDNTAKLTDKFEVRFSALVHDIAKPSTKRFEKDKGWTFHGHDEIGARMMKKIAKRMKLSNELREYLMKLIRLHLRPIVLAKSGITDSAVRRVMFKAGDDIDDLMILCRADITTKNPNKVKKYMANFERVELLMQDVKMRDEMRSFQSPVRGDVIMKDLQLKPGPSVGKIKSAIEDAILDGRIKNDYEEAYQFMLDIKDSLINN